MPAAPRVMACPQQAPYQLLHRASSPLRGFAHLSPGLVPHPVSEGICKAGHPEAGSVLPSPAPGPCGRPHTEATEAEPGTNWPLRLAQPSHSTGLQADGLLSLCSALDSELVTGMVPPFFIKRKESSESVRGGLPGSFPKIKMQK